MIALCLGGGGFLCYFIYDVNSVRKIAGWMNGLFMTGTILIVAATTVLFWKSRRVLFQTPADLFWMAGGVFFCVFLYIHCFLPCLLRKHMWKKADTGRLIQRGCTLCVGIPVFYGLQEFICA